VHFEQVVGKIPAEVALEAVRCTAPASGVQGKGSRKLLIARAATLGTGSRPAVAAEILGAAAAAVQPGDASMGRRSATYRPY